MINTATIALAKGVEFLFAEPDGDGYIIVASMIKGPVPKVDVRRFYWDEDQGKYRPTGKGVKMSIPSTKRVIDGLLTEVFGE